MADFKARRHRLELPPLPTTDDPAVLKRAMDQMKRLVQDEFNRLSTDFYNFKQDAYNAAILPLRAPSNIVVTWDEFSMSATWELPDGDDVTPTHVRVRILEISPNSWAEYSYPKTSWEFAGLDPGTQYTFQIQLVARFEATDTFVSSTRVCPSVPVLRVAESDIKARVFTTLDGVGPPTDAGTNDDNVDFTFPNTDGTPGAVGSSDCWWGYKFQVRTACAWADTAVSEAFAAGNVGDVTIDTGNAPFSTSPNSVYRLAYREICDGVAGDWTYTQPFMAVDFSNADCLGIVKSDSLTESPYDTADLFALPGVCQADGTWLQIVNALDDTEFFPMEPGFACIEYIDNEWTILADDTTDTAISNTIFTGLLQGQTTGIGNLGDQSDFTLHMDIYVADNSLYLAVGTAPYNIVVLGDKIKIQLLEDSSTYSLQVVVPRDGGGSYTFRADSLAYATWNSFYYVHDVSEPDGRILYVNNVEITRSANAILNDFTGIDDSVLVNTVNDMKIRKLYAWASAVGVELSGTAGYILGDISGSTYQTVIYKLPFSTETFATSSETLTDANTYGAGVSDNGVAGYVMGGQSGSAVSLYVNDIEKMAYPTDTQSKLSATLDDDVTSPCGGASDTGTAGYMFGGQNDTPATDDEIRKLTFPAETVSTITAVIASAQLFGTAFENKNTAGYSIGGNSSTRVDKLTYSTESISALTAMTGNSRLAAGLFSGTAGYHAGGEVTSDTDAIYKWPFSTDTRSTLSAVLSEAKQNPSGISDPWSSGGGYACGGVVGASTGQNDADKLTFATEAISTLTSTLASSSSGGAGVSDGTA